VGAGVGDGLYLPEARVHALGWEERLPDFTGWTEEENLPQKTDEPVVLWAPVVRRVMTATIARLHFPGWEGRLRLRGTVQATAAGWLDISLNGAPAQRVPIAAAGRHDFELAFAGHPGANTLELLRPPHGGPALEFFRLTIDDGAVAAGP
jgi:hypothetical protein